MAKLGLVAALFAAALGGTTKARAQPLSVAEPSNVEIASPGFTTAAPGAPLYSGGFAEPDLSLVAPTHHAPQSAPYSAPLIAEPSLSADIFGTANVYDPGASTADPISLSGESLDPWQPCGTCSCGQCGCPTCQRQQKPAPCIPCPHVSTLFPNWNVHIFGTLQGNVMYNTARPIAPGIPLLLAPGVATQQDTVDVFARSSSLGAAFIGPKLGTFQAGGTAVFLFYNDALIIDRYGLLPIQAWGDLKNERWRFAAGLQFNVFAPNLPNMLTFASALASGNTGNNFVGQFRVERYFHPSSDSDLTFQFAISDPVATGVISNTPVSVLITGAPALRLTEDNGWPTLEGRFAFAQGEMRQEGLEKKRAFESGMSIIGGQLRTAIPLNPNVVANTFGLASDFRWRITDRFGVQGETFVGQGLGFQNGGILQSVNSVTFRAIRTRGGWAETYLYITPCLHTHTGFAIDDPRNGDLAAGQANRNQTIFGNLIWDVTKQLRFGFEYTYRETDFNVLNNNRGSGFHSQVQWSF